MKELVLSFSLGPDACTDTRHTPKNGAVGGGVQALSRSGTHGDGHVSPRTGILRAEGHRGKRGLREGALPHPPAAE